jgi:transposase
MTPGPEEIKTVLGLDVARHSVSIHNSLNGRTLCVANEAGALHAALHPLRRCQLAVCEATGGHEDVLLAVLHQLAIPTHRADAAKVRAYVASFGKRAKTDAMDARWLARYGQDRAPRLQAWRPPDPQQQRLEALVARRQDLVAMRVMERNRLKAPRGHMAKDSILPHIGLLNRLIQQAEAEIKALLASHKTLSERASILRSVPGIGPVLAPLLMALMPELGRLNRRQAASLAACAPHPRDSGKNNPHRRTTGGRRQLRPALFIAALTAARGTSTLAAHYKKLLAAGKPKRLALSAIMRKIIVIANARLRDAQTNHPQLT